MRKILSSSEREATIKTRSQEDSYCMDRGPPPDPNHYLLIEDHLPNRHKRWVHSSKRVGSSTLGRYIYLYIDYRNKTGLEHDIDSTPSRNPVHFSSNNGTPIQHLHQEPAVVQHNVPQPFHRR
ncbi:hypothetical protein TNCV_4318311 [Trichonephila clavipes]|nr:hypothetical protein TNCV_4318311 [Trichonephila clavipes]